MFLQESTHRRLHGSVTPGSDVFLQQLAQILASLRTHPLPQFKSPGTVSLPDRQAGIRQVFTRDIQAGRKFERLLPVLFCLFDIA
jgi:hypothetical protein